MGTGAVSIFFQLNITAKLHEKVGRHGAIMVGGVCLATGLCLIAFIGTDPRAVRGLPQLFLGLALMGCGMAAASPSISALLSRYAGATEQGATLGFSNALQSLARVVGPVAWGFLYESVDYRLPFLASAGAGVLLAILTYVELLLNRGLPEHQMVQDELGGRVDTDREILVELQKQYDTEKEHVVALQKQNAQLRMMLRTYEATYGPLGTGGDGILADPADQPDVTGMRLRCGNTHAE
jgi:MFS family permease